MRLLVLLCRAGCYYLLMSAHCPADKPGPPLGMAKLEKGTIVCDLTTLGSPVTSAGIQSTHHQHASKLVEFMTVYIRMYILHSIANIVKYDRMFVYIELGTPCKRTGEH